jgi:hypothetical protein
MGLDKEGVAGGDRDTMILGWQIKAGLVFIPTLIYGALFLFETLPVTERVEAGVSSKEMYSEALRPMFLLWAFCMLMTASVELGPQQWQNSVLTKTSDISGTYILMYTSFMMFLLRHFAGPIAHKLSPIGMLTGSSVLTAAGLYLLSTADSAVTAFAFATVYGLGIVFYWPTMLGVTAERFPRGGAFLLGLMGCVGNLAISVILPVMGGIYDQATLDTLPAEIRAQVSVNGKLDADKLEQVKEGGRKTGELGALPQAKGPNEQAVDKAEIEGARQAFRKVAVLPLVLVVIFGSIVVADRLRGGYRPEELGGKEELTPDELASDY